MALCRDTTTYKEDNFLPAYTFDDNARSRIRARSTAIVRPLASSEICCSKLARLACLFMRVGLRLTF